MLKIQWPVRWIRRPDPGGAKSPAAQLPFPPVSPDAARVMILRRPGLRAAPSSNARVQRTTVICQTVAVCRGAGRIENIGLHFPAIGISIITYQLHCLTAVLHGVMTVNKRKRVPAHLLIRTQLKKRFLTECTWSFPGLVIHRFKVSSATAGAC